MTTIIVIVVVALVFFVAVCVASFMIWKRESEMRTDSIRAIEENLERLAGELSIDADTDAKTRAAAGDAERDTTYVKRAESEADRSTISSRPEGASGSKAPGSKNDPFGWIHEAENADAHIPVSTSPSNEEDVEDEAANSLDNRDDMNAEDDTTSGHVESAAEEPAKISETDIPQAEGQAAVETSPPPEPIAEETDRETAGEIDLDFIENFIEKNDEENSPDHVEPPSIEADCDVGKSGKRYTATELEELIRE